MEVQQRASRRGTPGGGKRCTSRRIGAAAGVREKWIRLNTLEHERSKGDMSNIQSFIYTLIHHSFHPLLLLVSLLFFDWETKLDLQKSIKHTSDNHKTLQSKTNQLQSFSSFLSSSVAAISHLFLKSIEIQICFISRRKHFLSKWKQHVILKFSCDCRCLIWRDFFTMKPFSEERCPLETQGGT